MKSRRQHSVFIAFLLVISVGVWATTVAAQGNSPHTTPVLNGEFHADPVNVMTRVCGTHVEFRGKWAGTISSSDDRLTGVLEFMAQSALVDTATGLGTFHGPFSVSDADTGMQTARGEFFTVVTDGFLNHGFAVGKVMNQNGPSEDFFARFQSTLTPPPGLHVDGFFGRFVPPVPPADLRTPAVVQGGNCSGQWTRIRP